MKNILAFLQSKWRRFITKYNLDTFLDEVSIGEYLSFPKFKQEQVIWRRAYLETHAQGKICLQNNECPCKCVTSEVIISDPSCDKGCFPDMLGEKEWEEFKTRNRIKVDLNYKKIIKYVN